MIGHIITISIFFILCTVLGNISGLEGLFGLVFIALAISYIHVIAKENHLKRPRK